MVHVSKAVARVGSASWLASWFEGHRARVFQDFVRANAELQNFEIDQPRAETSDKIVLDFEPWYD